MLRVWWAGCVGSVRWWVVLDFGWGVVGVGGGGGN